MRTNATAVGIVLAAALIGLSAPDATAQAGKTLKIRFGNSQGLGETTADTMADFKKEVEAKSNGQIQVELYPAGQLGKIEEVVEMLRPVLCDEQGRWTGDYIRLRFAAHLAA